VKLASGGDKVTVPAGATAGQLSLHPCHHGTEQGSYAADCGTLVVPENRFEVPREVSPKNSCRFGISVEFADQAAYAAYNDHPEHTRFVEQRWLPEVSDFFGLLRERHAAQ
jgi:hypothetical protein